MADKAIDWTETCAKFHKALKRKFPDQRVSVRRVSHKDEIADGEEWDFLIEKGGDIDVHITSVGNFVGKPQAILDKVLSLPDPGSAVYDLRG